MQSDDGYVKVVGKYEPSDSGRDFLYQAAVRQRAGGSFGAALVTLGRLQERNPDFSRSCEELGLCAYLEAERVLLPRRRHRVDVAVRSR